MLYATILGSLEKSRKFFLIAKGDSGRDLNLRKGLYEP